jgi:soluble lytic murein transglycosylase-like protein
MPLPRVLIKVALSLVIGALFPTSILAQSQFPDVIRATKTQTKVQTTQFLNALSAIDIKLISADEEKAVIFFARGVAELSTNLKAAAENFSAAHNLLPANSALKALAAIYSGRASVAPENARQTLSKLKLEVTTNPKRSSLWRPEQFALMLEVMIALKQDASLAKVWGEMESRVKPAMRPEDVTKKIVRYIEQRPAQALKALVPVMESMASSYPHSETGRWAFQKLQSLMCNPKDPYVMSQSLVIRLASNTNLDEGLKHYLIEVTKGPMRAVNGKQISLDDIERVNFLIQIRMWNEARRLLEEELEALQGVSSPNNKIRLARVLSQLGLVQSKQGDNEAAAQTWSRYIEVFGEVADWRSAYEGLADTLVRMRMHAAAAKMYELLAKSPSADPVLKWHHFWNSYLAGDYQSALSLLDRGGYVPQRDRGIEGGLDYWRAKILEKLGKGKESEALYQNVIMQAGDSFYAMLVQAKKPSLVEATKTESFATHDISLESLPEFNLAQQSGAAQNSVEETMASTAPSEIKTVIALKKWGQYQTGRRIHRLIPAVRSKNGRSEWIESFRLANELKDFSYGLKAPSMPESPLRATPTAVMPLEQHMTRFNADWKLLYPYAYREVVEPMAQVAGIDPFLVLSLMRAESVYDVEARSIVGARGLMQIMPFTAVRIARTMGDAQFSLDELHHPEVNIGYGAFYVKKLIDYYKGNTMLAVAAYNGGPTSVDRWLTQYGNLEMDELIESIPFRETRRYVKTVFTNYDNYKRVWQQTKALASLPSVPKSNSNDDIF